MTKEGEGEKGSLNKSELNINRGFELMIRDHTKKREEEKSKSIKINFSKTLSFFSREFGFSFSFSFNQKKI
jgi:hypothetical protein